MCLISSPRRRRGARRLVVLLVFVDGVGSLVFVLGGGWTERSRPRSRSRRGGSEVVVVVGGGGAVSVRKKPPVSVVSPGSGVMGGRASVVVVFGHDRHASRIERDRIAELVERRRGSGLRTVQRTRIARLRSGLECLGHDRALRTVRHRKPAARFVDLRHDDAVGRREVDVRLAAPSPPA